MAEFLDSVEDMIKLVQGVYWKNRIICFSNRSIHLKLRIQVIKKYSGDIMTQINDEFMEAYKHLDKICREIFSAEKGVTTYIDEMREISDGSRFVSSWNNVLNRLIQLRKIRNDYAHEVGNAYEDICSPADIQWLNDFYNAILLTSDPLALYRKATSSRAIPRKSDTTRPAPINPNNYQPYAPLYPQEQRRSNTGLIIALCIIIGAIIAGVLYLSFIYL
jgi:hypothetical protein